MYLHTRGWPRGAAMPPLLCMRVASPPAARPACSAAPVSTTRKHRTERTLLRVERAPRAGRHGARALSDDASNGGAGDRDRLSLRVTGMTCGHCEAAVRRALEQVPTCGAVLKVEAASDLAVVQLAAGAPSDGSAVRELVSAVSRAGFDAAPCDD